MAGRERGMISIAQQVRELEDQLSRTRDPYAQYLIEAKIDELNELADPGDPFGELADRDEDAMFGRDR